MLYFVGVSKLQDYSSFRSEQCVSLPAVSITLIQNQSSKNLKYWSFPISTMYLCWSSISNLEMELCQHTSQPYSRHILITTTLAVLMIQCILWHILLHPNTALEIIYQVFWKKFLPSLPTKLKLTHQMDFQPIARIIIFTYTGNRAAFVTVTFVLEQPKSYFVFVLIPTICLFYCSLYLWLCVLLSTIIHVFLYTFFSPVFSFVICNMLPIISY